MSKGNKSKKAKKTTGVLPNITKRRKPQTRDEEMVSIVHSQHGYDLKAAADLVAAIRQNEIRRTT